MGTHSLFPTHLHRRRLFHLLRSPPPRLGLLDSFLPPALRFRLSTSTPPCPRPRVQVHVSKTGRDTGASIGSVGLEEGNTLCCTARYRTVHRWIGNLDAYLPSLNLLGLEPTAGRCVKGDGDDQCSIIQQYTKQEVPLGGVDKWLVQPYCRRLALEPKRYVDHPTSTVQR